jgi:serine/threonine-protein phosphatase 5
MASSDLEAATALKVQGNQAFKEHEWPTAIDFYTQAIEKYDREPSFFCNRAQVRLRRAGLASAGGGVSFVDCLLITGVIGAY